jgi:hypothetical protein
MDEFSPWDRVARAIMPVDVLSRFRALDVGTGPMVAIDHGDVMVVETKKAFDEEHGEEARKHAQKDDLRLIGRLEQGMRQHVQQANPQHDPGYQADGEL